MELPKQELLLAEHEFINPLKEPPKKVKRETVENEKTVRNISNTPSKLPEEIFPEQRHEEKEIAEAREILGKKAANFTKEQLKDTITEIKYLASTWLDEFERGLFDGKTLNELLHEKEGL